MDWIDQHYRPLMESSLAATVGRAVGLAFHVRTEQVPVLEERPRGPLPTRSDCHLSPHNTFDTFIVGIGNQFAHAVAQAVAQSPGTRYNPLFMWGGVGLGKTHLMHAIGNQVRALRPGARIFLVSAEKFMNEMIYAIPSEPPRNSQTTCKRPTCPGWTRPARSRTASPPRKGI